MCTTCGCGEGNLYIEGDEHNPHSAFRSAPFAPAPRQMMNITGVKTDNLSPPARRLATCTTVTARRVPMRRARASGGCWKWKSTCWIKTTVWPPATARASPLKTSWC